MSDTTPKAWFNDTTGQVIPANGLHDWLYRTGCSMVQREDGRIFITAGNGSVTDDPGLFELRDDVQPAQPTFDATGYETGLSQGDLMAKTLGFSDEATVTQFRAEGHQVSDDGEHATDCKGCAERRNTPDQPRVQFIAGNASDFFGLLRQLLTGDSDAEAPNGAPISLRMIDVQALYYLLGATEANLRAEVEQRKGNVFAAARLRAEGSELNGQMMDVFGAGFTVDQFGAWLREVGTRLHAIDAYIHDSGCNGDHHRDVLHVNPF